MLLLTDLLFSLFLGLELVLNILVMCQMYPILLPTMLSTLLSHHDLMWVFYLSVFQFTNPLSIVPSLLLNQSLFWHYFPYWSLHFIIFYRFQFSGEITWLVIYFLAHINHCYLKIHFQIFFGFFSMASFSLLVLFSFSWFCLPICLINFHWLKSRMNMSL